VPIVLVDTNVWVSALINPYGFPARLKDAWLAGRFNVVISVPILEEIADVLTRPRIQSKYKLSDNDIQELLQLLQERTRHAELIGAVRLCRDPDDDQVLETALVGGAEMLVSRDDDLKDDVDLITQMQIKGIRVLSVQRFLNWLDEYQPS